MWHTSTEEVQDYAWLVGKGDSGRTVQEIKVCPYYQMIYP